MIQAFNWVAFFTASVASLCGKVDFNQEVRPILANNCFKCHGPDAKARKAKLRLDLPEGVAKDLGGYRAVEPGKPDESEMIVRITSRDPDELMPPPKSKKTLTPKQIATLRAWIAEGGEYQTHWAFMKPKRPEPPKTSDDSWIRNPIDRFVLARLEKEGMRPSPEADKATLLRRVSFDLTGLPPSLTELEEFLADDSPKAFEKAVDRLLSSPRYGEHLAHYWLDAARYADTNGYQYDTHRDMWPWRDWVINAYNRNLSFDQFTIEQLAGDLLPSATLAQKIATGFNRNHPITIEGGVIDEEYRTEYVIDRVTTTAQVWMGMSFLCARCHDHKFDPVQQKEFYQFFAFFNQVPEKGHNGFNPKIKVPAANLSRLRAELAVVEQKLKGHENAISTAQSKWEKSLKVKTTAPVWEVIKPTKVSGGKGTTFTPLPDLSILAGGNSPVNEIYDIHLRAQETGITAVRLECLKHKSLPHGGAGRAFNSNFVLSEFELEITHSGKGQKPQRIKFKQAVADYSQNNYNIAASIDGNKGTGWAVDGPTNKENRVAMFVADKPFGQEGGADLRIRMHFNYPKHAIGRFRLSISADPMPMLKSGESVSEIAALPSAKRTPQQKQLLREHFLTTDAPPEFKSLHSRLQSLRAELKGPQAKGSTTMVMQDMPNRRKTHVLFRGQYDQKREEVTVGTPAFLPPMLKGAPMNRLGLARWLFSEDHPLTARVIVNREWQRFFGTGIVMTTEEFGTQGDWPSHPKLLDWLAVHFKDNGWDLKNLLKTIVTCSTYRQSSWASSELLLRDPENRLLGRGPRHRLDAEV
ncbi:MAG: PSD1 and planctomycete cytochrome C domain-containing protein, partial [Opitutales bacterium]